MKIKLNSNIVLMTSILMLLCSTLTAYGQTSDVNLALGKTATQSGDIGQPFKTNEGLASTAVDGNTDGNWFSGSVTSTAWGIDAKNECQGSPNPWWQVDLGAVYQVDKIEIWNRTDCCKERLNNYRLWVKGTEGDWEEFSPGLISYSEGRTRAFLTEANKLVL